jgi:hypothetical protein
MFSIYSEREEAPHVPILVPFWGVNPEDPGDPSAGRYDRYSATGSSFLTLTSLAEADAAVFPQSWAGALASVDGLERARRFTAHAAEAGKPAVVFFWSDLEDRVPLDAIVLRTSLSRSTRLATEFAQPAWSEDFLERYLGGTPSLRTKRVRPTVGFCGFAPEPKRRFGRRFAGGTARVLALNELQRSAFVDTNIVLRAEFMGGAADNAGLRRVRAEYVQNMVESDYVLCARGAGNFSYRLYETLSCGRIPVFVDTDCVLPLEFAVDWHDYCVWIDERDVGQIGERVAEFHERLSENEFLDLQRACRRFWETHISPEGFFSKFHLHF